MLATGSPRSPGQGFGCTRVVMHPAGQYIRPTTGPRAPARRSSASGSSGIPDGVTVSIAGLEAGDCQCRLQPDLGSLTRAWSDSLSGDACLQLRTLACSAPGAGCVLSPWRGLTPPDRARCGRSLWVGLAWCGESAPAAQAGGQGQVGCRIFPTPRRRLSRLTECVGFGILARPRQDGMHWKGIPLCQGPGRRQDAGPGLSS